MGYFFPAGVNSEIKEVQGRTDSMEIGLGPCGHIPLLPIVLLPQI